MGLRGLCGVGRSLRGLGGSCDGCTVLIGLDSPHMGFMVVAGVKQFFWGFCGSSGAGLSL